MHVDLTVYDFFTNVQLMLGWILNNAAWDVLNQTMIAAVPFIALVVGEWFDARRVGDDEGDKGLLSLNRIETRLYAMLLVYLFCAVPLMSVTFAPVKVDQSYLDSCAVRVAESTTTTGVGASIGGVSPRIPVWWAAVHAFSRGVTNAMISALPCQTDFLYMRTEINNTAIRDPLLKREVARFQQVCYGAARSKLFELSDGLTPVQAWSVDWIGSDFFLNNPGYYGSFSANKPVNGFPYDPATDFGRGTTPAQGGYPSCKQWWLAPDIGLKDRLHDQIDTSLWQQIQGAFTPAVAEDYAIRGLLHNYTGGAQGNAGGVSADIGGNGGINGMIGGVMGFFGTLWETPGMLGEKDVMSRALPMVQHFLMMLIVVAIPFVLVLSGYSFKVVGVLTFSYFGLATVSFWFQVSRWLGNNLVDMVYNSNAAELSFVAGIGSTYDIGVLGQVQAAMQLLFPLAWLTVLGWSGWKVGSGADKALQTGGDKVGKAGAAKI